MTQRELIDRLTGFVAQAAKDASGAAHTIPPTDTPASPGDVLVLPTASPVVHWVVVKPHPEDSTLLFAVPADDVSDVGATDVPAAGGGWGPGTVRCGYGIWAHADALDPALRVGRVAPALLSSVRAVLDRLAAGTLRPTEEQSATDADPDHLAWLDVVERSREAARKWLDGAGRFFRWSQMATVVPHALTAWASRTGGLAESPYSLAAEGGGFRGWLSSQLADAYRLRWAELADEFPGLFLAADPNGVRAAWVPGAGRPPRLRVHGAGSARPARWTREGDIHTTSPWPWVEGRVVLLVGPGAGRKVVVRK